MDAFADKVAVVTGAGSGLGRALACELARHRATLAVCDSDAEGLSATAELVEAAGASVFSRPRDVADCAAVRAFAKDVRGRLGMVHQVYNNAGLAQVATVEDTGYADLQRIMAVNFWGVVHGTKEFLPYLIESGDGHLVTISSVLGIVAVPHMAGYAATKFAVRGFTEGLRAELLAARRPVKVTCVHPGGIRTPIVQHAETGPGEDRRAIERRFRRVAMSSPRSAARAVLRGVARGKPRVLVGPDAYGMDMAHRLIGARYERLAAWGARWFVPAPKT